jgi:hypothetical protein
MHTMRTIGMIVLGCLASSIAVLIALILWLGIGAGLAVGLSIAGAVVGAYVTVIGPWHRRWGATAAEVDRAMPGDELLRSEAPGTTRAITIEASAEKVFPWLLQIGYGRGGWYSYDWIDNDGRPSLTRIHPDLQRLSVGDRIEMTPGMGPTVREINPGHHILSAGEADTWCLLVEPAPGRRTRLISRWRQDWPKSPATYIWLALADPGAFLMEQKMLRTIRDHAERSARESAVHASPGGPL